MLRPSPNHGTLRLLNDDDDALFETACLLYLVEDGWPMYHLQLAFAKAAEAVEPLFDS